MINDWSLTNLPPEGHEDCGEFFYSLYDAALSEQKRLRIRDNALDNHALYRGMRNIRNREERNKAFTQINLFFANVERTVSNITANNPSAEVVDLDGFKDGSEETMTARLRAWWKETGQRQKHKDSARNMEIYGYTSEKPYWDHDKKIPDISVMDLFAVIPAPGVWRDWAVDPPFLCFLNVDFVDALEAKYGVDGIAPDETYDVMGDQRKEYSKARIGSKNLYGNYSQVMSPISGGTTVSSEQFRKGLVIEIWIRGASGTIKEQSPMIDETTGTQISDPTTGDMLYQETTRPKYPDGIRKVSITRADITKATNKSSQRGVMVLDDTPNPNINPKLPIDLAETTYTWGRIPIFKADSYRDTVSSYGFSAAEQVGDLLYKIEEIFTRLYAYARQALSPTLIIEKNCGITKDMIESNISKPRLILMPTKPGADIRYLETPNLPSTFFQVLDLFVNFFDRIYQIEDADRGKAPNGIIAASAIVALQERNSVLMQSKIDSSDTLCSERGMWAIGFWQNFGTKEEPLDVNGGQTIFRGVDYAGRRLNYAVEAGSTRPKTSLQVEEQVKWLAEMKLIGPRDVLESMNFPNWKAIVERNGESKLDMAMTILIEAGLPKDAAVQLKQMLLMPQGGPGDTIGNNPQPEVPKIAQGQPQNTQPQGVGV